MVSQRERMGSVIPAEAIPPVPMGELRGPFYLASGSPRRAELLECAGVPYTRLAVSVEEWEPTVAEPNSLVQENATRKALAGAALQPGGIVLGADTVVSIDQRILGKPRDEEEARAMLRCLSGREHAVYTGIVLVWAEQELRRFHCERSEVVFKSLSERDIADYLTRVHTLDKAGGYGIQEERERIIAHVRGSFSNVMGLPLEALFRVMEQAALFSGPHT